MRRPPNNTKLPQSSAQYGDKKTPARMDAAIKALAGGLTPAEAAAAAGIGRSTLFDWRRKDSKFADRWEEAADEGIDKLEQEAFRRGVLGTARPVFQGKELVGHVQEYSDTLLVLMLKGRRPERYNTDRHEHVGKGGGPVEHSMEVTFVTSKQKD